MSEADAEDGLHGLDVYLDGKNEGTILDFAFWSRRFALQRRSPPEPPSAPFNSKMHPPAKKKKHGEAERGEGGRAEAARRGRSRVGTRAERTKESQVTTHALCPSVSLAKAGSVRKVSNL